MEKISLNKGLLFAPAILLAGCSGPHNEGHNQTDYADEGVRAGQNEAYCAAAPFVNAVTLEEDLRTTYRNGATVRHDKLVEVRQGIACDSNEHPILSAIGDALIESGAHDSSLTQRQYEEGVIRGYSLAACAVRPYITGDLSAEANDARALGDVVRAEGIEKLVAEMNACTRPTK